MLRSRSSTDSHTLVTLIARHAQGIGVDGLLRALGEGVARRTLQRRLAELVAQGRVLTRGEARALKYFPAPAGAVLAAMEPLPAVAPAPYVTLSAESAELRDLVRRPLHLRRPVGYDIGFVERYRANDTFYLPEPLRAQMHVLGRSPVGEAAAGTFAGDILNRLLIDLSWASSQLEGNTYSRLDTERLIELGEIAEGKDALETQMILNHKVAIEYLVHGAARVGVDRETLLSLHALLSDGLLRDPQAGGRVRSRAVEISGCVYRPLALPQQLDELFGIVTDIGRVRSVVET
ncbi:MAG: cell filamentation protein Fic, partial [Methyloversatilis sp. 12-65-5]